MHYYINTKSIITFVLTVFCLYLPQVVSQTPQSPPTNTVSEATNYRNCKAEAMALLLPRIEADCGSRTGADARNCRAAYKITPHVVKFACRQYKYIQHIYRSRQSPVNILNAGNLDEDTNDPSNALWDGRYEVGDGTDFVDVSAFADVALTFERSDPNIDLSDFGTSSFDVKSLPRNFYYTPTTSVQVGYNNGLYDLERVDIKFPSDHTLSGEAGDAEVQYVFSRATSQPNYSNNDVIDEDTTLIIAFLLKHYDGAGDCINGVLTNSLESGPFNSFLQFPLATTVEVTSPMLNRVYAYAGSLTSSPYTARTRWFVSAYFFNLESTLPTQYKGSFNYPNRPPVRAIFSEALLVKTNALSDDYIVDGCTETD
jgi:hypothetical protein